MKLLKWVLLLTLFVGIPRAFAVVDVTSNELQAAADIVVPSGDSFGVLDGYSGFSLLSKSSVTGGIEALYQARLLADPWYSGELPNVQLVAYTYSSQDAAEQAFEALDRLSSFSNGQKTILASDSHSLYYQSNFGGNGVDVFQTVDAEYHGLHLVEWNGNVIFQASLFRSDGESDETNLQTFAKDIEDTDGVEKMLAGGIDNAQLAMGLLFPPTEAFWNSQSEKSSLDLSQSFSIPTHGTVHLKVYVSDPTGATGTILDSAGLNAPSDGDLYLYITSAGTLFAGMYAPNFDADCEQEAGWYRLQSHSTLNAYEWNTVDLHYGVGGFSVTLNGVKEASCSVSQPRSANDLYLGDFPGDNLAESMIGTVDDFSADYSMTDTGKKWDEVLTEQLFLDLPESDPDLAVFQYLKEKGVFLGSDGTLNPDDTLNRAQMVKVLLKAFNHNADGEVLAPFSDVPVDAWYRKYVAEAYSEGVVKGQADGSFSPAASINRAEFFTMLSRIKSSTLSYRDGAYSDVSSGDWFAAGAAFASAEGLVEESHFEPSDGVTRRFAARVLYTLMND